ncbi:TMEM43 family protein [Mesorhizobium sp. LHD-90]|uniref:TMEM43 family protein n=1 Tax=Mesorhizobium sp. LHD-90 TaxID=3071414 RepID=UPI0027E1669B|nr:TMEM43 family protein [Mesorhizobium sp. LHD-90]MDQ6436698.1 TMEM43 family protein [Mesorhizobium sp. LHD-90]
MSDSYREVTSTSWFGRIGRSVGGVVIGLLLIVGMIILLFWNEGRAVTTAKALAEGAGLIVSIPADTVDPGNDGKLVHVGGKTTTGTTPSDPDFGIAAPGLRLERSVEMYQWKQDSKSETTTKLGGGEETVTTYTYARGWSDRPIDSSGFKQPSGHSNPSMEIRDRSFQVPQAELGAFVLDQPVLDQVGDDERLALAPGQAGAVRDAFSGTAKVSIVDGRIYLGRDPASPAIGDYRISYRTVPADDLSVIGRQAGNRFEPYATKAGYDLLMVDSGLVPAEKMFAEAVTENTIFTWILRIAGLVLLFIGFALILAPLGVIFDVIPFLGSIMRLGTGAVAFVLALLAGGVTIAIAWFWYRPLLSITLIAIALAVAFLLSRLGKAKGPAPVSAPATASPQ